MKRIHYLFKTSILLLSIYVTSCKPAEENIHGASTTPNTENRLKAEEAYPGEYGVLHEGQLFGAKIAYSEINSRAIFEGDIILTAAQLNAVKSANDGKISRAQAAGTSPTSTRWPDNTVYYTIERSIADKDKVNQAIAIMANATPLNFVARTTQTNYVTFKSAIGFSSSVGLVGGQQFIELGTGFTVGQVLHELGHTVGLLHEHTRVDRDQTIKINLANVSTSAKHYFDTYQVQGVAGFDFGLMDISSIMMLDSYAYSRTGKPSMTLLNGSTYSVQRDHLSTKDIACITSMYSHLYMVKNDRLYAFNPEKSQRTELGGTWSQTDALAADSELIYAARTSNLWRANSLNGKATVIAPNFSGVKLMAKYKEFLYVIQNGNLILVNPTTGGNTQVNKQIWLTATAMTIYNGFFYIVSGDVLLRVTPQSGAYVIMGSGFLGSTEIAASAGNIWIVSKSSLYRVHPISGASFRMGASVWSADSQMAAYGGNLYIVNGDVLYKVDTTGDFQTISTGWSGTNQMTSIDNL